MPEEALNIPPLIIELLEVLKLRAVEITKPRWAVRQIYRTDRGGLPEYICAHGIGHPDAAWILAHRLPETESVHGCDGCCRV